MDLQTPSVLAQLPRPLHASAGQTQIGEVFSLADSKKRKRYEVVVAVDGEAVNIYNVQTPKLVTSYAVPPQSAFSCRPCSVRRKLTQKASVKRQTYSAVERPERQIKCFFEETSGRGTSAPVLSSSSFSVKDSDSPAIFVGIVPTGVSDEEETEEPFDVLAVHKDGRVRRLAADLQNQRWNLQHSEMAKISSTHEVHSCFLVDFDDLKKSLFRRRQDLAALALSDAMASGSSEPSILLMVSHPSGTDPISLKDVHVHIFAVSAAIEPSGFSADEDRKLRHLLTVDLPELEGQMAVERKNLQWSFHSGSAGLSLSFERGFISFDLSQYAPTVASQFILEEERFLSIMRISPQCVIGAGKSLVAVYDTQYQSMQRSIGTGDILPGSSAAKGPMAFVTYFAKLGVAVATRGSTLLAFDLSSLHIVSSTAPSLKRPRDGLLIDAIGRGVKSSATQWGPVSKKNRTEHMASLGLRSSEQVDQWNRLVDELTKATASKDTSAFDQAVQTFFGTFPTPEQFVHPEIPLFVLSKIFSLEKSTTTTTTTASASDKSSAPSQLRVALWPQRTCAWLVDSGRLSLNNIEIALRRTVKPRVLPPIPTGSLVRALIDLDPQQQKLLYILQSSAVLAPADLAHALKVILQTSTPEATFLPALTVTLQQLHRHPLPAVTAALRESLSRAELMATLHQLRIALATGGFTSRFTETIPELPPLTTSSTTSTDTDPPTPPASSNPLGITTPSPLSLETISDLLLAAVDAIGPSGWITASAATEAGLIADMRAEVSAALAGVEEASYLKGILREYLRYSTDVINTSSTAVATSTSTSTAVATAPAVATNVDVQYEKLNGADLLIYPDESTTTPDESRMLPLSLKAPTADVGRTKIKKSTGEVKSRSNREIGYLRRKAGGKYSFERLVV
ncbi:hypothetical protein ASPZODRAFT_153250 [Penicilliopsis zonata CBS 506.65]|uniref:Utp8 beta-propeller domain-containing protein n=1 Tax=Penicilliopsis zonata CBS 506.65 TaxID=1073090 RepID=A0A1L9SCP9_9EURO|nr:hypothetical protein ASPZODRAFT_153250 [Penicilliopsis zonata CBS 506.65]OJJ44912.1 hypothetical protein ASPZODRAFT_153250 [Penicilliopsis zonata CBS 506.65]